MAFGSNKSAVCLSASRGSCCHEAICQIISHLMFAEAVVMSITQRLVRFANGFLERLRRGIRLE